MIITDVLQIPTTLGGSLEINNTRFELFTFRKLPALPGENYFSMRPRPFFLSLSANEK
jgi:hypothetical protein